ncbi:uncharacterized protein J7T54_005716 [Emericellopsis cladophorae]|uniref:Transcription factor domain-containing protein n=1 Tax=Emericellopsis cladophorae TaxID=2686198 RepID=A0A9P9XTM2_9HYPO|nr:uncharacterized protein J7T54_005716 [Emericellopsis cladophorae]KAI6777639.1 hypothetical protein J7T54_005716 [Emericellopsis cladophorae]
MALDSSHTNTSKTVCGQNSFVTIGGPGADHVRAGEFHAFTTVATTRRDGLVSELVSDYFKWENAYLFPTIDREAFLVQMTGRDTKYSSWCTPLLVNSICAHRSSLAGRFLDEAESRLRDEQGKISIPTAQALMLRYFTMACMGRDRIGRACRQQAIDIVRRLNLEAQYDSIAGASRAELAEKSRLSKALWGLFIVETRFAYFYLQPSQITPPEIPHVFDRDEFNEPDRHGNIDVLGRPFEDSPCEVPLVAGIISHVCTLSELFYEVMRYNSADENDRGDERDINVRKAFYARLRQFEENLPQQTSANHNPSPSTIYLRMHQNEVAFAIIQNQRHEAPFEISADEPGIIIKDLCARHCRSDVEMAKMFLSYWAFEPCLWRHLYLSLQPLSLMLDRSECRQLFTAASAMMRAGYSSFRICGNLLQATQAFAWTVNEEIPREAQPHYEGCKENMETQDLPLSFALPRQDDAKELLKDKSKCQKGGSFSEDDLGSLIQMWTLQ